MLARHEGRGAVDRAGRVRRAPTGPAVEPDAPAGRRFEFLLQEVNREVNTVGSKAQHAGIAGHVVEMKAELERLREQATAEIEAEKVRAIAELRSEVADLALAAAGKVIGENMTGATQRRLVEDFLTETAGSSDRASRN